MTKTERIAIKSIVYAQAFVDTLDQFEGTNAYRQRLKQKAKHFKAEVDKFLDAAYCGGETEINVISSLFLYISFNNENKSLFLELLK